MSDKRKRIAGVGVLLICVASMIHANAERESPSIGWMLALSASWGLAVWLWPDNYPQSSWRSSLTWLRKLIKPCLILAVIFSAVAVGVGWSSDKWNPERSTLIAERDRAIAADVAVLNLAAATQWYIEPADEVYAEVLAWRKWADSVSAAFDWAALAPTQGRDSANEALRSAMDKKKMPERYDLKWRESPEGFAKKTNELTAQYRMWLDGLLR